MSTLAILSGPVTRFARIPWSSGNSVVESVLSLTRAYHSINHRQGKLLTYHYEDGNMEIKLASNFDDAKTYHYKEGQKLTGTQRHQQTEVKGENKHDFFLPRAPHALLSTRDATSMPVRTDSARNTMSSSSRPFWGRTPWRSRPIKSPRAMETCT